MGIPQICGEHPGVPRESHPPTTTPRWGCSGPTCTSPASRSTGRTSSVWGESLGWGERLLEQFDRYNQKLNARNPITYELNAALEQVRENYHTSHLITAEECAQQMQERAEIYLKE